MEPKTQNEIIRNYESWPDKGPLINNTRITLTTSKLHYSTGEPIRISHYVEEVTTGRTLFIMGPKIIMNEFVNGTLATTKSEDKSDYPWLPLEYDGAVEPSPGIDYNFEDTEYRFDHPDIYRIQWRPGHYQSNILTITVQ